MTGEGAGSSGSFAGHLIFTGSIIQCHVFLTTSRMGGCPTLESKTLPLCRFARA
ncbi:hypothetical protein SacazDRAFT_01616 [Saccharomonospora azurea NA-128]|uniref:Uncharacterized protein n=1 Tax=Saccharomonospora azurea NA-128 TaxID=882081 RepID=H8GA14_9PSEU|nr:hypothetical protein SacazDRAFT_01616 [Saccharomonospora azurea NA-128]